MASSTVQDGCGTAEPIAVVGMAMRFPGDATSGDKFWEMLSKGRSAHGKIPSERFNSKGYYHPDSARAGSINVKGGYFLNEDPLLFDAPFFSMTANEANGTDPQQRHMLEVAYETLENAGIPIHTITGSSTSVYVGCFTKDYESVGGRDPYGSPFYAATGNGQSMLSNRVSWFFDLRGPSITIDTACSSSLHAVHLACQSLRLGESRLALVGGTNLISDPSYIRDLVTMTFLSPDGICHSFDHRANGYARGDGIGGMALKTLKQALADGDTIRGIVRNSSLNQDGRTPGITMPSPKAQADMIRSTYAGAGLSMDQTAYFEAHGTGTAIGDPGEASAIGLTFGSTRATDNPIYLGSVKTNIGHLEGCAGLAGLIKAVLVVERGQIPPLAGFEHANPMLKLDEWRIALPQVTTAWPVAGLRRASVNSFGYGGANAHVIVDDAYHYLEENGLEANHHTRICDSSSSSDSGFGSASTTPSSDVEDTPGRRRLFILSASAQSGLQSMASAYCDFIKEKISQEADVMPEKPKNWTPFMSDLAYTLCARRSMLDQRSFIAAATPEELAEQLQSGIPKLRRLAKAGNSIFVFTGQGAQWPGMGKALLTHQTFGNSLKQAETVAKGLGCTWSLIEELCAEKEASRINSPEFSQPLCTALQLALVDLLQSWAIVPKAVVGHSSGEIGAAYAAKMISHEDAMKVAYLRGVYSADVNRRQGSRRGAMMAVGLSPEGVKPYLDGLEPDTVVIACVNAPSSVTLSGDASAIDELETKIKDTGIFARKLRVDTAYHSPHMRIVAEDYLNSMGTLQPLHTHAGGVVMFSSVTAAPVTPQDLDAAYWVGNMLKPVMFSDAVKALVSQPFKGRLSRRAAVKYSGMIECGPAEALKGPLNQVLAAIDEKLVASVPYTSLLSRGANAEETALQAAGRLWAQGMNVDLSAVNFQSPLAKRKALPDLPTYPWNHASGYTHESGWGKRYRHNEKPRTDLLGMRLENQNPSEPRWHNYIRLTEQPWMADHKVQQAVVYPGAAMITMAFEAARELANPEFSIRALEARDIRFIRGIVIPGGDAPVETAIHLRPLAQTSTRTTSYAFQVFSQSGEESWKETCSGQVLLHYKNDGQDKSVDSSGWDNHAETYERVRKRSTKAISPSFFYKLFDRKMNLQYGPLHQNITACVAGLEEGHGTMTIPDTKAVMPHEFEYPHLIHPSTLDSVFHMQALGYLHSLSGEESLIPISIESIYVAADTPTAPGSMLKGYSKGTQDQTGDSVGDIVLSDEEWLTPKIVVRAFLSRDMSLNTSKPVDLSSQVPKCTSLDWVNLEEPANTEADVDPDQVAASSTISAQGLTPTNILAAEEKSLGITIVHGEFVSDGMQQLIEKLRVKLEAKRHAVQIERLDGMTQESMKGKNFISLLEAETPFVLDWTSQSFELWKIFATEAASILWITRGGEFEAEQDLAFSISTGLLRTVRVERPQLKLPHLDLPPSTVLAADSNVDNIMQAFDVSIVQDASVTEHEFIAAGNSLVVPRLVTQENFHVELAHGPRQPTFQEHSFGSSDRPIHGTLEDHGTLKWTHDETTRNDLGSHEVEIRSNVVGFEPEGDSASARDSVGTIIGLGSAVTGFAVGDLVVAWASDTLRSHCRVDQDFIRHIPLTMEPVVAATMPSALCTAEYALVDCARLEPGESVLVCSGVGSTGQLVAILARSIGAEVYATSENSSHRRLLVESLGIAGDHVLGSPSDLGFAKELASVTDNKGFDVIIGNLHKVDTGCLLTNLKSFGRFVNLGKASEVTTADLHGRSAAVFNANLSPTEVSAHKKMAEIFSRGWQRLGNDVMKQVVTESLPCSETEKALRHVQTEECAAGFALIIAQDDFVSVLTPPLTALKLDSEATYVLSGGLGGVGRSIAELMVMNGARNISFISRSGAKSAEAKAFLESLRERGCNAQAYCCDISSAENVSDFVAASVGRGEIVKGVIQCAMVLRDSTFDNMTYSQWTESTASKVQGSWNLHAHFPKTLDFFIMLSSMAGIIGNPGQANYSAAGTYQDALSLHRRTQGLPSITIDLGIVSDVGYIAENVEQFERLEYLEPLFISERDLHLIIGAAIRGHTSNGAPVPAQLITGVGKELLQDGSIGTAMAADLKYSHLHAQAGADSGAGDSSADEMIKIDLMAARTLKDATSVVEGVLTTQLAKAINTEKENVDVDKALHEYGVDSLVAVEVRNMIFRRFKADISIFDILSSMPLAKLAIKIVSKSQYAMADVVALALEELVD